MSNTLIQGNRTHQNVTPYSKRFQQASNTVGSLVTRALCSVFGETCWTSAAHTVYIIFAGLRKHQRFFVILGRCCHERPRINILSIGVPGAQSIQRLHRKWCQLALLSSAKRSKGFYLILSAVGRSDTPISCCAALRKSWSVISRHDSRLLYQCLIAPGPLTVRAVAERLLAVVVPVQELSQELISTETNGEARTC